VGFGILRNTDENSKNAEVKSGINVTKYKKGEVVSVRFNTPMDIKSKIKK
jgi:hypothetical protein